jgi:hypothetical protein
VLRPGLAGGCINLWSAYLKDAQEGSGRRRRGKGLLDLEDVSLARGGREVVGTEDLLGGQSEWSRSHDLVSRASSSSRLFGPHNLSKQRQEQKEVPDPPF